MEIKRISVIALVVLLSASLLFYNNLIPAYALTQIDVTIAGNQNYSDLVDRNTATGDPCRLFSLTTLQKINVVNCDNHTVVTSNGTLATTGTACMNNSVIAGCNLGTGTFSGLECNRLFCYISFSNATSNILVRYTWTSTGFTSITGWHSQGGGSTIENDAIESIVTDVGASVTVWYALQCSGADADRVIRILDGVLMILSGQVDGATSCITASGTGGNLGVVNVNDIKFVSKGTSPSITNHLGVATNGATNNFRLFNLSVNTFTCQFSGVTSNQLAYHNTLTEFYLIANAVSGDVVRIENDASCTNNGTITDVTLGTTGQSLREGDVNEGRGEIYISDSSSKVVTVNNTYSKVWEYALIGDIDGLFAIESNATEVVGISTINKVRFVIISTTATPTPTPTGATVCIDTTGDAVADLCFTDTNGDGVADNGILGNLGIYRSNQNVTFMGFQWFCAFGVGSCTDANPKTNGVGLWYLLFLIIISYALLVFIHYQAQHMISKSNVQVMDVLHINPILLLVMLMIDLGLTFFLGWIPDLIFYTVIVILLGLSAFGVYKKVTGVG